MQSAPPTAQPAAQQTTSSPSSTSSKPGRRLPWAPTAPSLPRARASPMLENGAGTSGSGGRAGTWMQPDGGEGRFSHSTPSGPSPSSNAYPIASTSSQLYGPAGLRANQHAANTPHLPTLPHPSSSRTPYPTFDGGSSTPRPPEPPVASTSSRRLSGLPVPPRAGRRGPADDDLLFGTYDKKPAPGSSTPTVSVKREHGHPQQTREEQLLFSKAKKVRELPQFPPTVQRPPTAMPKPARPPAAFKSVGALNEKRRAQAAQLGGKKPASEHNQHAAERSGEDSAWETDLDASVDPQQQQRKKRVPRLRSSSPPEPVASTSARRSSTSSVPTSSPTQPIQPVYSQSVLARANRAPAAVDSDSADEIVASAASRVGAARKRGAKEKGKGKAREKRHGERQSSKKRPLEGAVGTSGKAGGAGSQKKEKRARPRPEAEAWRDVDVEQSVRGVPVPKNWRTLTLTVCSVTFRRGDMRDERGAPLRTLYGVLQADLNGGSSYLGGHTLPCDLSATSLPDLPPDNQAYAPDKESPPRHDFPIPEPSLSSLSTLVLSFTFFTGRTQFSASLPLACLTSPPHATTASLTFDGQPAPVGVRVSVAFAPVAAPLAPEDRVQALRSHIEQLALDSDPQSSVWIPDAIPIRPRLDREKSRSSMVMPELGTGRCGYSFITKEPIEAGEVVEPYIDDTVKTTAALKILSSPISPEEMVIKRCHCRMGLVNPIPPSVALLEIATWRLYAPVLHHYQLRLHLCRHLIDLLRVKVIDEEDLRDALVAYDEEVGKVKKGQRMGYEEWKRRAKFKAEQEATGGRA
ncbi:hypothetical protein JCM10213_008146 [Rhodosporidiobolus nylandii]